jgi:hypothetical protein
VVDKSYLVVTKDGELRVTVPENWKVTYGPIAPGTRGWNGVQNLAIRFYESAEKQRAIFTDVISFRDLSIKVEKKKATRIRREGADAAELRFDPEFEVEWLLEDEGLEFQNIVEE